VKPNRQRNVVFRAGGGGGQGWPLLDAAATFRWADSAIVVAAVVAVTRPLVVAVASAHRKEATATGDEQEQEQEQLQRQRAKATATGPPKGGRYGRLEQQQGKGVGEVRRRRRGGEERPFDPTLAGLRVNRARAIQMTTWTEAAESPISNRQLARLETWSKSRETKAFGET
jgi:hypothetical protein